MNTRQIASSGSLHPICSAWWMYDNHTFQKVDVTAPNWRGYVMTCYDIDGFGSFFVRESPNGKTIFDLHGRGKKGRDAFAAALDAWTPPNDSALARIGAAGGSNEETEPRTSNDDATPAPLCVASSAIVLPELPMTESAKLAKAIELLESAIADFKKLQPFIGDAAQATADIYQQELNTIKQ